MRARTYSLILGLVVLAALALRLHEFSSQILGDDEWHGLQVAISAPYAEILTTFRKADNCIPLTLLYKLLLGSIGLSESVARAMPLVAGVLAVLLLPILAARYLGSRAEVTLLFAALVAVSPLAIYYSRYARPYSIVFLLSGLALLFGARWIERGSGRFAVMYALLAVLTPYFNPPAAPTVLAPLLFAGLLVVKGAFFGGRPERTPDVADVLAVGTGIGVGISLWFLPAARTFAEVSTKAGQGGLPSTESLLSFLGLFAGSGNGVVIALFCAAFLVGLVSFVRSRPLLAGMLVLALVAQYSAILVTRPLFSQASIIFARYSIGCLWIVLLLVALGLFETVHWSTRRAPSAVRGALLVAALAGLFAAGPIPFVYLARTNSFTNHEDFQYDYRKRGPRLPEEGDPRPFLPAFYSDLEERGDVDAIIEFPQVLWWSATPYHFYQRIHGKRVMIGHLAKSYLLHGRTMHEDLRLDNYVDVEDADAVRSSGAAYLVIHRDPAWETPRTAHVFRTGTDATYVRPANKMEDRFGSLGRRTAVRLVAEYAGELGPPEYQDAWISVFRIP